MELIGLIKQAFRTRSVILPFGNQALNLRLYLFIYWYFIRTDRCPAVTIQLHDNRVHK
jgi:hypothetical protein